MKKMDTGLVEVVDAGGASVRLRNVVRAVCDSKNPPFVTVGEYLSNRAENEQKLQRWPNAGAKTVAEFNSLLDLFCANESHPIGQGKQGPSSAIGKTPKLIKGVEELQETSRKITSLFPGLFDKFVKQVGALCAAEQIDEAVLWKLIKDGKAILKLGNKGSMLKMRQDGATLEEVANFWNVTRQWVQQLESRLKPYLTDITSREWLQSKLILIDAYKCGVMPSNEELDACHPCLKSALKAHYLGDKRSIRATKTPLKPLERKQLSELLGLKLDDETSSDLLKRWSLERVIKEIREFAAELGTPDLMPKQHEQTAARKTALRGAITRFGGQSKIAELAGLKYQGQLVNDDGSRTYCVEFGLKLSRRFGLNLARQKAAYALSGYV